MKADERNKRVRKWIRENGAVNFDFNNRDIILEDGLLFAIESELKELPKMICNCESEGLDFKNKDIILSDGVIFKIEKEIQNLKKVKNLKPTFTKGIYQVELTKKKYKTECYKCRIWFEELDELIEYFQGMKKLLNELGYKTSRKNGEENGNLN